MQQFCKHCGARLGDGDHFCQSCGARLDNTSPANHPRRASGRYRAMVVVSIPIAVAAALLVTTRHTMIGTMGATPWSLGGSYYNVKSGERIELNSDGSCSIWQGSEGMPCTFKVDGDTITVATNSPLIPLMSGRIFSKPQKALVFDMVNPMMGNTSREVYLKK